MWFPVHLANAILEFPSRPHGCAMSLEDGKHEINLEWPKALPYKKKWELEVSKRELGGIFLLYFWQAKCGPDHCWQAKLLGHFWQGESTFSSQNWYPRTNFGCKNWTGDPVLARSNFCVTG